MILRNYNFNPNTFTVSNGPTLKNTYDCVVLGHILKIIPFFPTIQIAL